MQPNAAHDNPDPRQAGAPGPSREQSTFVAPTNPYFANPPANSYNNANETAGYGFGQKHNGFDANVMASGGGFAIPTPQNDDLYSNPFSS